MSLLVGVNTVTAGSKTGAAALSLTSIGAGAITGQITLQPHSTNSSPFSMTLAPITINLTGAVRSAGDFDEDGDADVEGADFLIWQRQLGNAPAVAAGAGAPEPGAFVIAAAIGAGLTVARWQKRRLI